MTIFYWNHARDRIRFAEWAETWQRLLAFDAAYAASTALPAAEPAVGGGCAECAASSAAEAKAGAELFSQRKAEAAGELRARARAWLLPFLGPPCVLSFCGARAALLFSLAGR